MANENTKERIVGTLRHVADNIDAYLPEEWLLEGSSFVLRIPDRTELCTVELDAVMPADCRVHPTTESGTASVQS